MELQSPQAVGDEMGAEVGAVDAWLATDVQRRLEQLDAVRRCLGKEADLEVTVIEFKTNASGSAASNPRSWARMYGMQCDVYEAAARELLTPRAEVAMVTVENGTAVHWSRERDARVIERDGMLGVASTQGRTAASDLITALPGRTRSAVLSTLEGISGGHFHATPSVGACMFCAFQRACVHALE